MPAPKNPYDKAVKEATRKIPLASVKHRNEMLKMADVDMAEAYEIGVEETQAEIVTRLQKLQREWKP